MNQNLMVDVHMDGRHGAVTTSRNVADVFGKQHKSVLRSIENLDIDRHNFEQMFYETVSPDSYGRKQKTYIMNRDGLSLLAMGFTGKEAMRWKLKYIEAFNQMEQAVRSKQVASNLTAERIGELMKQAARIAEEVRGTPYEAAVRALWDTRSAAAPSLLEEKHSAKLTANHTDYRRYRCEIYTNQNQREAIRLNAKAYAAVWNFYANSYNAWRQMGNEPKSWNCSVSPAALKKTDEYGWMKAASSVVLATAMYSFARARYNERRMMRDEVVRLSVSGNCNIRVGSNTVTLPKLGVLRTTTPLSLSGDIPVRANLSVENGKYILELICRKGIAS